MKQRARLLALFTCALLAASSAPAFAANPCESGGASTPGSGIGGTGVRDEPNGIGGTGRSTDPGGIGGTGRSTEPGGIGGTGRGPNEPGEGGIGGTGRARAIVGTVTGYASLCVAGIEVQVNDAALEAGGGAPTLPAIGETVEVVANGEGEVVSALSVTRRPLVVGPIQSIDEKTSTLRVLGQDIVFGTDTHARGADGNDGAMGAASFEVGLTVRVSGWRRDDGRIEAARIDAAAEAPALLHGSVTKLGEHSVHIDGTAVELHDVAVMPKLGESVTAIGRAEGDTLIAARIETPMAELLGRGIDRIDVDSMVAADGRSVSVDSQRLAVPADAKVIAGNRVRVSARIERGGMLVLDGLRPAIPPRPPIGGPVHGPAGHFGGRPPLPPPRPDRPERPPFPDRPPPRPPRPEHRPPPPPPRIPLPERR